MEYQITFRIDGIIKKRYSPKPLEKATTTLSRIAEDWSRNGLFPLTKEGETPTNNAHLVTREDDLHLTVLTTEGRRLSWTIRPIGTANAPAPTAQKMR